MNLAVDESAVRLMSVPPPFAPVVVHEVNVQLSNTAEDADSTYTPPALFVEEHCWKETVASVREADGSDAYSPPPSAALH